MTDGQATEIIEQIKALRSGEALVYHTGKTYWLGYLTKESRQRFLRFFEKYANDFFFLQERIDTNEEGHFKYIAVRKK